MPSPLTTQPKVTTHGPWSSNWITDWDEVWSDNFVSRWRDWMKRSANGHVFFEPMVVRAWYDTYRKLRRIQPRFFIAKNESGATFFLPMVLDNGGWKDAWQRVIRPVGYSEFDYHDPIATGITTREAWPEFWNLFDIEIHRFGQTIDACMVPRLNELHLPSRDGYMQAGKAPFIELSEHASIDELLRGVSKHVRQELRRQPRRLGKIGEIAMRVFQRHEVDEARQHLSRFLDAHGARWPKAYQASGFLENLIRQCLPNGLLHLSVLSCGQHPISWHFGFARNRRFYYYLPAFDRDWSTYSPGKLHLAYLIEWAHSRQFEVFDFLSGEEPYKYQWTSDAQQLYEWRVETPGVVPRSKRFLLDRIRPMMLATRRQFVDRRSRATGNRKRP